MPERGVAPGLGEFLRARRALVRPEDHGMPAGPRRTPGLRREEVAMLAGVSTDYYIRLEQGRDKHPVTAGRRGADRGVAAGGRGGRVPARPGRSGHVAALPPGAPPGVRLPWTGRADARLAPHPGA